MFWFWCTLTSTPTLSKRPTKHFRIVLSTVESHESGHPHDRNLVSAYGRCTLTGRLLALLRLINTFPFSGVWQKISKKPVCFGAKNNKYGAFKMTKTGRVKSMKLVRRSGSIRCDLITSASYWGCILSYPKNSLMTIITNANQQALFPPFNKLKETKPLALCKKKHFYALKLVGHKSKNLVYDNLASPLPLARNQELRIWYGQDWIGCLEFDNSGATCVDVYAWYLWTMTES